LQQSRDYPETKDCEHQRSRTRPIPDPKVAYLHRAPPFVSARLNAARAALENGKGRRDKRDGPRKFPAPA
jgi:hypothetical protein